MAENDELIEHAIKRPGALTRKANKAGKSVDEYAEEHKDDLGRTGMQARFYLNVLKPADYE